MRTSIRLLIALFALALALLAGGWTYQRVAERGDDRRYPAPGALYPVDGRLMHIHCKGTGSPTIIVEQGSGGPSIDWNDINGRMTDISRVCAYDRAGMGYSEPAYQPTLAVDVARNLRELLRAAKLEDDVVLVGWSAGGLYAREYYRQSPERVKGMVLVDSPHEQTPQRMPAQPSNREHLDRLMRKYHLARFGWLRLAGDVEQQYAGAELPMEDRMRLIAFFHKSHAYRTLVDEGIGLEQDLARGAPSPLLGDIPLVVIAQGQPRHPYMVENLGRWHELQRELAGLSTSGKLVIAERSAHFIHRSEPEVLLKAVSEVVECARAREAHPPSPANGACAARR